jgi:hypothetical protein
MHAKNGFHAAKTRPPSSLTPATCHDSKALRFSSPCSHSQSTPEQTARFVATQSSTFEATWNAIEPSAASVIFPAQYMNNREDKIRTLDLSTELLQMNQADGKIDQKTYADRFLTILKQRAPLGKVDDDFYPHTTPPPPHIGHDSSRITTGLGSYDSHEFKQTWNEFRCSLQLFF